MNRQTITVDLSPGKDPIRRLSVTQGDIGRPLGVYIKQDGAAFDLSDYSVELYVLKPDGNYYSAEVEVDSVENNLVIWDTAEQETPLAGECEAQIRVIDGSVNVGTAEFIEYVEKSPGDVGVDSETELNTIASTIRSIVPGLFEVGSHKISIPSIAAKSGSKISSTITRSGGYIPLGVIGTYITNDITTLTIECCRIGSRTLGSGSAQFTVYNQASSASAADTSAYIYVLWIKEA